MNFKFDKDDLKESLSIDQIFGLVAELGGEPIMDKNGGFFTSKTICHNHLGEGSHKLYYYENTHLFKCYTDCGTSFDIYELVCKVKTLAGMDWNLPKSIAFVASFFGVAAHSSDFENLHENLQDWEIFENHDKINALSNSKQIVELKIYDDTILKNLPTPRILPWEKEGISREVMMHRGICYDPLNQGIVIPHYNVDGELVGIRERTLVKENEQYGKYRPAILNRQMYNHPLGFNLYNLNNSKDAIKALGQAIVWEGEKSSLLYASYFGEENDITAAACGSSLISYQVKLLLAAGAEEIIVGFDKQFKEIGDDEWKRWTKKLTDINTKYGAYCRISFLFDKNGLLGYKDSPIDRGPDVFKQLYKERISL